MEKTRPARRPRRSLALAAAALAVALVAGSCSDDDDGAQPEPAAGGTSTTTGPPSDPGEGAPFEGRAPDEISAPTEEGNGANLPQPVAPLPDGYVEEEYFVAGTATSFSADELPEDGTWAAAPAGEAEYRTRVVVRRPESADDFSGTVLLEWFNVSAIEASPDWSYLSEEIGRRGHAYVGVSAQAQGVEGGDTILDVEVDPEAAEDAGVAADTSGLKNIDPERYGTLEHPGDAFAFDIFSQVGRSAAEAPGDLLGDLEPTQVLAVGESQSAGFLSTLVNAVHPLDPVFDGFLIHSRGASIPPLDGQFRRAVDDEGEAGEDGEDGDAAALPERVLIRTDLDVPVLLFEAETDLTLLGYVAARQPDTDLVRTWEVAGTAHADAHVLRSVLGGPRDPSVGDLLGCADPINTGPHHEVVQAALHHLVEWAAGGPPPPPGEPIRLEEGDETVIARDEHQLALGGVRNPLVDVPVAALTGDPPDGATLDDLRGGQGGVCLLFGRTIPFDQATLVELHGDADGYLEAFRASADEAVDAGFLLREDADQLVEEAEANRALFER